MPTLDTSVLVEVIRGRPAAAQRVSQVVEAGRTLYVAPHTVFELYRGVYSRSAQADELGRVKKAIARLALLPFDEEAARLAALMAEELRAGGSPIPERDIFIGACSIASGDRSVLTKDTTHFELMTEFGISVEPL